MNSMAALWASIAIGGIAQILLKRGVSGRIYFSRLPSFAWWAGLLRSGWLWAWGISFVIATGLWLVALSRIEISYAFPLLSSSYVLVAVLSKWLLNESVSASRWLAMVVICAGVILIAVA
ncbi:MAG TPA: EamA family transporter [Terriglobia bacterium]|jgi:drug/metabolite transporter (DMT)-like permease|nr:EamA family transporter [Terriglobia bacterium]